MVRPNTFDGDYTVVRLHLWSCKTTTCDDSRSKNRIVLWCFFWCVFSLRKTSALPLFLYFCLFWQLCDSPSNEIGYKTATFAGHEHGYQHPDRQREEKEMGWGQQKQQQKKCFTPISALLHRLPEIDLLITNKAVHVLFCLFFFPDTFHFLSMCSWLFSHSLRKRLRSKKDRVFAVWVLESLLSVEICFCQLVSHCFYYNTPFLII